MTKVADGAAVAPSQPIKALIPPFSPRRCPPVEKFPTDLAPIRQDNNTPDLLLNDNALNLAQLQNATRPTEVRARRQAYKRARRTDARYRTTPITFEEIREVDEEYSNTPPADSSQSSPESDPDTPSPYAHHSSSTEDLFFGGYSNRLAPRFRSRTPPSPVLSAPHPKDGRRHWRSNESLIAMHETGSQPLPSIPEIMPSPSDLRDIDLDICLLVDSETCGLSPRTYSLPSGYKR